MAHKDKVKRILDAQAGLDESCREMEETCKHYLNQWALLAGGEMEMRKLVAESLGKWMEDGAKASKPAGSKFLPGDMPALTEAVRNLAAACFVANWFTERLPVLWLIGSMKC